MCALVPSICWWFEAVILQMLNRHKNDITKKLYLPVTQHFKQLDPDFNRIHEPVIEQKTNWNDYNLDDVDLKMRRCGWWPLRQISIRDQMKKLYRIVSYRRSLNDKCKTTRKLTVWFVEQQRKKYKFNIHVATNEHHWITCSSHGTSTYKIWRG